MKLKDIYEEFLNGKKIRRKSWKEGSWININNITVLGKESLTAEDWEIVEEKKKKKKWWEPEIRGNYYCISGAGHISCNPYDDDDIDKRFLSLGNCFQTEKQAEFMTEKLRVIHELEKFAFENNEEEIDWNNSEQRKYYLYFDYTDMSIVSCDSYSKCQHIPLAVYFTSKEIADKSIKAIGEERLKKYYFGVR
jgi:hypothetical protein